MDPNQINQQQTNQTATPLDQVPGAYPTGQASPPLAKGGAPVAKANINSTQNLLEIAEIRDGIVIMNDGSYRSVVMVKPINFDLMSTREKQSVEFSFQGFLNSLYFPIQIFIHSEKVDLGPYLQKLTKLRSEQDNMLLAMLMDDYIGFMEFLCLNRPISWIKSST